MEIVKLVVRRKQLKLSSGELAARLNITQATMSKYENGKREPGLTFFERWIKELGIEMTLMIKPDKV